jgi:hypothetical protein
MNKEKIKDPYAVILGRKGGKAAAAKMTAKQRHERALNAAQCRWKHLDKGEKVVIK